VIIFEKEGRESPKKSIVEKFRVQGKLFLRKTLTRGKKFKPWNLILK